jgi:hypothetical protein
VFSEKTVSRAVCFIAGTGTKAEVRRQFRACAPSNEGTGGS